MSRAPLAGAVLAAMLAVAGCASGGEGSASGTNGNEKVQVQIMKDSGVGHYHPGSVEVPAGGTVIWTNRSGVVHNVVFDEASIQSSSLFNDGETFEARFDRNGVYEYHCTLHPTMRGAVRVG